MMIVVFVSLDVISFSVTSISYRGESSSIYSVHALGGKAARREQTQNRVSIDIAARREALLQQQCPTAEQLKEAYETFAERYAVIDLEMVKRILSKDVHIFPDKER